MEKIKSWAIPSHLRFLLSIYLIGMAFFTLSRILLFLTNLSRLSALPPRWIGLISRAFLMGLRFDSAVSAYILLIPFLIFSVMSFFPKRNHPLLNKWITLFCGLLYTLAFFICSVDIPYFNHFFSRISTGIFAWIDTPDFMFKMVIQEVRYWIFILPFVFSSVLFWFFLVRFRKKYLESGDSHSRIQHPLCLANRIAFFLIFSILVFVGLRGRLAIKSPIRIGTAYFSSFAFPNQIGLNPVFTLARSLLDDLNPQDRSIDLMPDSQAIDLSREYMDLFPGDFSRSPIARPIAADGPPVRANVVLVIMESMAAEYLSRYGNTRGLTPNLDRIARESLAFDRVYTSGTHTYSGVYSTLFGFPVVLRHNPLKSVSMLNYSGLPGNLHDNGYRTIFFIPHDDQFDNLGGFLRANGFERIVSQKDYPFKRVLSTLGVPDDFMFEFSLPLLDRIHGKGGLFFAAFLTSSNHSPLVIPRDIPFKPRNRKKELQMVEYADWALGKFMNMARRSEWFKDTIFVFVADHGVYLESTYDLPLSLFHTPLLIHAPGILKDPREIGRIGGQIDVFPTVMGILNLSYLNNSLGIDLLRETRPHIFFSSDDKIGCLNQRFFLVIRNHGFESLYHYPSRDPRDYRRLRRGMLAKMKTYCFSMLQTAQWMIKNQKVGDRFPE